MKKLTSILLKITLVGVLFIAAPQVKAADSYTLSTLSQTYTNLTGSTVASTANWDYMTFNTTIPIGFTFPYFDRNFTSISLYPGEIAFSVAGSEDYWIIPFSCGDLISKGSGLSPISYQVSGTTGNKILKIEFKNAGIDLTTEYVNVQAWLFENGTIEYHFGTNTISASTIGYTMVALMNFTSLEALSLTGSPTAPTLVNDFLFLTSAPANGTVYRFTKNAADVKNVLAESVKLYPNPTNGQVTVSAPGITSIEVYSLMGEKVLSTSTETTFDISDQPSGVYMVKVQAGDAVVTEKVVKK